MQLFYDRKTTRSIPRVDFPSFFSLSATPKDFSNTDESVKIMKEILVPYFELQRKELGLDEKFRALLILDVFRQQMTQEVTLLLAEKKILIMKVPINMTPLLQPLDLLINGWVKQWVRYRFADWYAEKIGAGLEKGLELESIEVKLTLTVMKPLHARWLN